MIPLSPLHWYNIRILSFHFHPSAIHCPHQYQLRGCLFNAFHWVHVYFTVDKLLTACLPVLLFHPGLGPAMAELKVSTSVQSHPTVIIREIPLTTPAQGKLKQVHLETAASSHSLINRLEIAARE